MSSKAANVPLQSSVLADLYAREWPSLVRLAFLLTGSQPDAEELAQDAFVHLQATSAELTNPAAYVPSSVINACRSFHRHRGVVHRTAPIRPEPFTDERDELFDALAHLPWRQHAVLVLYFHVDLPEAEIAAALGCRPSTVRSIKQRALATLRKELSL